MRRGLLVSRSVTIEGRHLRGVEISEPMLTRWAGGARLNAVASGLGDRDENRRRRSLSPPGPRAEALRVVAAIQEPAPTALRPHPRIALRRRVNGALAVVALIVAPLLCLGLWPAACIAALVLLPAAVALAWDAYRALGHGVQGRHLVARAGVLDRRTAILQRDGIIGWSVSRSPFQRRHGLVTLGATTAAGDGCYKVRDVPVSEGLRFAEEAVPGLLAHFLVRE
ncbi:PH domain-containing protein [Nonomuraea sp. NPDC005983]|uniref:PH domain-containing protein n=1 Tax=Nonomuraea sp. NPDC005983 TaxID=3155595 RepID=UPI0033BEA759